MANPDWGAVDSKLVRKSPAHYEDGVYLMAETNRCEEKQCIILYEVGFKNDFPRPSPRSLSEAFMKGSDGHGSVRNRTTMLAFFGQVSRDSYFLTCCCPQQNIMTDSTGQPLMICTASVHARLTYCTRRLSPPRS